MYFNRQTRTAYLAHPRTASVATASGLLALPGWDRCGKHHSDLPIEIAEERDEWLIMTTIRNPYDVAVSWVFSRSHPDPEIDWGDVQTFREVLENNSWIKNNRLFWHVESSHLIFKYEGSGYFDELGFSPSRNPGNLGRQIRFWIPGFELPEKNISKTREGRHYSDFYNSETAKYVGNIFAYEIEKYEYMAP